MRRYYRLSCNFQKGQTLIEVLLALGIAVLIVTSIATVIIVSLDNATYSKNQNLANFYAQEGLEITKGIRDRSWTNFWSYNSSGPQGYLLDGGSNVLGSAVNENCPPTCTPNVAGVFIRTVKIEKNHGDCVGGSSQFSKVTVTVSWRDGKCSQTGSDRFCHKARLTTCFVQDQVSAP